MAHQITIDASGEGAPSFEFANRPEGLWRGGEQDYYQDDRGQTHHLMEDVILNEEPQGFNETEYESACAELAFGSVGNFQAVAAWAASNVEPELLEAFNEDVGSGDPGRIERALEWLKAEFTEGNTRQEETETDAEEDDVLDEWFDNLSDEQVDGTVEALLATELGEAEAETLANLEGEYPEGSVHAAILSIGQEVAAGYLDMYQAIEAITEAYGEPAAAAAYYELQARLT
jgi:hypothetical protein